MHYRIVQRFLLHLQNPKGIISIPIQLRNAMENLMRTQKQELSLQMAMAGVLQGDTLAPYLFAIVLDFVLRQTYKDREKELGFKRRL